MTSTRQRRVVALTTATVAATLATMVASPMVATAAPATLQEVTFSPAVGTADLMDVYPVDNGAWVAMRRDHDWNPSEVQRCDFHACAAVNVPNIGGLRKFAGVSDTEVYLSGKEGVLRLDGGTWKDTGFPKRSSSSIGDIKAVGHNNVWVLATHATSSGDISRIEQWDGSQWREGPALPAGFQASSIEASGHDDVWVYGSDGGASWSRSKAMRWDGRSWSSSLADPVQRRSFTVTGRGEVWIYGGKGDESSPVSEELTPYLARFNGTDWVEADITSPLGAEIREYTDVHSVWRDGRRLILSIGLRAAAPSAFLVSDDNGVTWRKMDTPSFADGGTVSGEFRVHGKGETWFTGYKGGLRLAHGRI